MEIFIWILPVLFAITVHEYAHGWMAYKLGDNTAKSMGRLTINPIAHIDTIGTIVVPVLLYLTGGFLFGWAKPVPINYNALSDKKTGVLKVSLAGPISNAIMAIMWGIIAYAGLYIESELMIRMGAIGVLFNLLLGLFNMLPIPPLDGSSLVRQYLPYRYLPQWDKLEIYGIFIVLSLVVMGVLSLVIWPILSFIVEPFPMMKEMIILVMQ